eukprot:COSAG05_NODE_5_length_47078_cov_547.868814_15_plen_106_part_00
MAMLTIAACSNHNIVEAPGNSRVIRKTVQHNSKVPVTSFSFFMHALCAHAQIYMYSYRSSKLARSMYRYRSILVLLVSHRCSIYRTGPDRTGTAVVVQLYQQIYL